MAHPPAVAVARSHVFGNEPEPFSLGDLLADLLQKLLVLVWADQQRGSEGFEAPLLGRRCCGREAEAEAY
jgi:hypothetical protein